MKKILWICDEPNWAYDINVKVLIKNIPLFEHQIIYINLNQKPVDSDIVVITSTLYLDRVKRLDNVFSILDSVRNKLPNSLSQVAGIICCNSFLYNFAKVINQNTLLQPNGVDLNYYCPSKQKTQIFTVGFAGNVQGNAGEYKGFPIYREALEQLNNIRQLNASYGQLQIPSDKMVERFYHKINCLVLLSVNEGCSNVITEALACGIPIICTRVGYHGEALENYKQCIFVNRDVEDVKQAIIELSKDSNLQINMGVEARKFAELNHDIRKVALSYSNMFEKYLAKK